MRKDFRDNNYFKWGLTALAVIAIALICNQILSDWDYVINFAGAVITALRPIILGLVFAYVLNPLLGVFEKYVFGKLYALIFKKNAKVAIKMTRGTSIVFTLITAVAIVSGLMLLIVPELYVNINRLISSLPGYIENCIDYITTFTKENPEMATPIVEYLQEISQDLLLWASNTLLPNANQVITNLSKGIYVTFKVVLDVIIGVIVAVYVLAAKERYSSGAKKYLYAVLKKDHARKIINLAKYTDNHFGGFLVGKILDSAIIGVLSFVVFSIFNIPYTLLVSVIVGVTNVIPFFGPFLGAIPCGVLILLVNPAKALVFAILILAIQQLDGNIIGPKILGEKTGLDSFAVIFAILISGGLFGIVGMIVGVPVFATIFGIITAVCNKKLENKDMPISVSAYENDEKLFEAVDNSEE